jgi:hypothetical protein
MSSSYKKVLRVLAIAAAVAVVSIAFLPGASGSGPYASVLDDSGRATPVAKKCANTGCLSACWIGGCATNPGTECVKTTRFPGDCNFRFGCYSRVCTP